VPPKYPTNPPFTEIRRAPTASRGGIAVLVPPRPIAVLACKHLPPRRSCKLPPGTTPATRPNSRHSPNYRSRVAQHRTDSPLIAKQRSQPSRAQAHHPPSAARRSRETDAAQPRRPPLPSPPDTGRPPPATRHSPPPAHQLAGRRSWGIAELDRPDHRRPRPIADLVGSARTHLAPSPHVDLGEFVLSGSRNSPRSRTGLPECRSRTEYRAVTSHSVEIQSTL
jgi:hypothetical protein